MEECVLQRVISICRQKSVSESQFAKMIGSNQKTINQQFRGERSISLDTISKILSSFEDISAEWLLRGEGPMLKSETGKINIDLISEQIESSSLVKVLVRSLESYQKHEDDLLNAIENLKKENNKLKQGLSNSKAS